MRESFRLVSLPQIPEPRGNLTALEELVHLPFRIGSVRWFYDLPAGTSWAASEPGLGDALLVALSGSFDVAIGPNRVRLSRANTGLQLPASLEWRIEDPATNSVGLLMSSGPTHARRVEPDELGAAASRDLNTRSTIDDCRRITLPHHRRRQGSTTEVLPQATVPFDVLRVYYLYDVPGGAERGGHAHRRLHEVLVSVAGSFDVVLNDGRRVKSIRLDRAHSGVFMATGIWRELRNFSSGAICLVLASAPYDEADYIRDYEDFRREKGVVHQRSAVRRERNSAASFLR
jgi:WxcM-like, C-terminal